MRYAVDLTSWEETVTGGFRAGRTGHHILCEAISLAERPCMPRVPRPRPPRRRTEGRFYRQGRCHRLPHRVAPGALPAPADPCPPRPAPHGLGTPTSPTAPLGPPLLPPSPSPAALRARPQSWTALGHPDRGRGDTTAGLHWGRADLASRCRATTSSPRRGPTVILLSPAVGSALPLAAPTLRSAPIERPPPLPRPHWRAALWPRCVTFSHHSSRLLRQLRAGRRAGGTWTVAAVIGRGRRRSGCWPEPGRRGCLKAPRASIVPFYCACERRCGVVSGTGSYRLG